MIFGLFKFANGSYSFLDVIVAALMAVFLWCFGDLGLSLGIILVLTLADFVTGIMRAAAFGLVESRKIMRTVHKIVGYTILISTLNIVFIRFLPFIPSMDPSVNSPGAYCLFPEIVVHTFAIIPYICAALIVIREAASIVENLAATGILPPGVAKILSKWFKVIQESIESGKDPKSDV